MAEGRRYLELKLLAQQGEIENLKLQVRFPLLVNGVKVCAYVADFVYEQDGIEIVEDRKGFQTPVFKLKKKLFEACYPGRKILIT